MSFVVIGGGFGVAGFEWLVPAALETAKRDALDAAGETLQIVRAELGTMAGLFRRRPARVRSALMLSVCATPIGNLEDVTLRVLRELREADVVLCEDTRHTRVLLERHDIRAKLLSYHEHNEAKRTAEVLPRLLAGERVALVSDADARDLRPGRAVDRRGARRGSAGDCPARARRRWRPRSLRAGSSASATSSSAICRAARRRWRRSGASLRAGRGRSSPSSRRSACRGRCARWRPSCPTRPVAVCRELTKRFEEVVRGTAEEIAARFAEPPKGEIVLVLGAAEPVVDEDAGARGGGGARRARLARRQAAELVARLTGASRNALFKRSL